MGSRRGRSPPRPALPLATARPNRRNARLADPGRFLGRWDDDHFDLRHFVDAQRTVGVEVALQWPAGVDGDLGKKYMTESKTDPTLHLRADHIGIDGHAT